VWTFACTGGARIFIWLHECTGAVALE
jgi:hypothetical protein